MFMTEASRRSQMLQVARKLFSEKGYHATTIRDIADQTGVLSGSLYAHIRTKEDLLFEITCDVADQFVTMLKAITSSHLSATAKFRRALTAHIAIVAEHIDAATVFSHEWKALSEARKQVIKSKRDAYEQMWAEILQEGAARGEFRQTDLRFARMTVLSVANWLYQWYDPHGELSVDEVAQRLADNLLLGIRT
jgi:AcrR family transcriptional regulator